MEPRGTPVTGQRDEAKPVEETENQLTPGLLCPEAIEPLAFRF